MTDAEDHYFAVGMVQRGGVTELLPESQDLGPSEFAIIRKMLIFFFPSCARTILGEAFLEKKLPAK